METILLATMLKENPNIEKLVKLVVPSSFSNGQNSQVLKTKILLQVEHNYYTKQLPNLMGNTSETTVNPRWWCFLFECWMVDSISMDSFCCEFANVSMSETLFSTSEILDCHGKKRQRVIITAAS